MDPSKRVGRFVPRTLEGLAYLNAEANLTVSRHKRIPKIDGETLVYLVGRGSARNL